jgi:hypothetical protein
MRSKMLQPSHLIRRKQCSCEGGHKRLDLTCHVSGGVSGHIRAVVLARAAVPMSVQAPCIRILIPISDLQAVHAGDRRKIADSTHQRVNQGSAKVRLGRRRK